METDRLIFALLQTCVSHWWELYSGKAHVRLSQFLPNIADRTVNNVAITLFRSLGSRAAVTCDEAQLNF